jgi:AraC-like DNA-binding protein
MSTDALSDVLRAVKLTGAVFFTVDVSTPWLAPVPSGKTLRSIIMPSAQHLISFHLVTAGGGWTIPQHSEPVRLGVGDVVVFPGGDPHVMCSDPKAPPSAAFDLRSLPPIVQWPHHIGDQSDAPDRLGLICGFLGCDVRPFNPLLAALPRTLVLSDPTGVDGRLGQFTRLAVAELTSKHAGSEGVLGRLSELMFVEAVRMHLNSLPAEQTGWLAGLRDRQVGGALTLMHGKPAHPWTIEELARDVGLSRSAFADRFMHFVGQPPMHYLAQWRMQLAAGLLSSGSTSIAAIARDVGYGSEAAFSRAFKKLVGAPPAAWRRRYGHEHVRRQTAVHVEPLDTSVAAVE